MSTITLKEEALILQALKGVRDSKYFNFTFTARQLKCDYDVLRARSKGIKGNWSKRGKNKRLVDEEKATLIRYYKRRIFINDLLYQLVYRGSLFILPL
jgi:hypothetical protein